MQDENKNSLDEEETKQSCEQSKRSLGSTTASCTGTAGSGKSSGNGKSLTILVDKVELILEQTDVNREELLALFSELGNADVADVIQSLSGSMQELLLQHLGDKFDFDVMLNLDREVRLRVVNFMGVRAVAKRIADLDSDEAVYILEDLDQDIQVSILSYLPRIDRESLYESLDYPEESVGRRMQREFIALPPFWQVGQVIDYLRNGTNLPENFNRLWIVDAAFKLQGFITLDTLLRSLRKVKISTLVEVMPVQIKATDDQEEAARLIQRSQLLEAAIVDDRGRMVGILTPDNVLEVVEEEVLEDFQLISGVDDEELSDNFLSVSRSRIVWLLLNLLTAIFASMVISLFQDVLDSFVILAILMPIVASMGGNAATQTMAVTIRALSLKELQGARVRRMLWRELGVGLLNGLVIAFCCATVAFIWFNDANVAIILAIALVINHLIAGFAGFVVPFGLEKLSYDPAISSTVFITTITDVVGFLSFLGLATFFYFTIS